MARVTYEAPEEERRRVAEDPSFTKYYCRYASSTQTSGAAWRQIYSGELWGRQPSYSSWPQVQAYRFPLPTGKEGIEFATNVLPDQRFGPVATWSWGPNGKPRPGVIVAGGVAKIAIIVIRSTQ